MRCLEGASQSNNERYGSVSDTEIHLLINDPEVREFPREAAPPRVDSLNSRRSGALLCPAVKLSNRGFFAFSADFHRPVWAILDPATQPKSTCLALGGRTKIDALNATSDGELELFQCHICLFSSGPSWIPRAVRDEIAQ